jgi:hypothetical protein
MGRRRAGNPRFAPRGPQQIAPGNNIMPAGGNSGMNMGLRNRFNQDPRQVTPSNNLTPRGGQGGMNNNMGTLNQDPRYIKPSDNNIPFGGNQGNNNNMGSTGDPRFASGRRPAGLPNVNLRKPGSGGSRVMGRPTAGNFQRMQPKQNRLQKGVFPQGNSMSDKLGY